MLKQQLFNALFPGNFFFFVPFYFLRERSQMGAKNNERKKGLLLLFSTFPQMVYLPPPPHASLPSPPLFHLRSLILPPSKPVFVRSRRSLWATVCSNCCHSEKEKGEKTKGSCRKRKSCTCTRFAQEVFSLNSPPLPFFQLLWKKRNFNSSLFPQRRQFEVE